MNVRPSNGLFRSGSAMLTVWCCLSVLAGEFERDLNEAGPLEVGVFCFLQERSRTGVSDDSAGFSLTEVKSNAS